MCFIEGRIPKKNQLQLKNTKEKIISALGPEQLYMWLGFGSFCKQN